MAASASAASSRRPRRLLACAAVALLAATRASADGNSSSTPSTGLPDAFVKVKDGRLVIGSDCKEFYLCARAALAACCCCPPPPTLLPTTMMRLSPASAIAARLLHLLLLARARRRPTHCQLRRPTRRGDGVGAYLVTTGRRPACLHPISCCARSSGWNHWEVLEEATVPGAPTFEQDKSF